MINESAEILSYRRTIWSWKFQNATPPAVFIGCPPNFIRTLASIGEYRMLLFLALYQLLNILRHFEFFNMGVNGKILKCACKVVKMVDNGAKHMKIWDS